MTRSRSPGGPGIPGVARARAAALALAAAAVACGPVSPPTPLAPAPPAPAAAVAAARAAAASDGNGPVISLGFADEKHGFTASPGDRLALEPSGHPAGAVLRWEVDRSAGPFRALIRDFAPGALAGTARFRFQAAASAPGDLWVQLEEAGGEAFYRVVEPAPGFETFSLHFEDLTLAEDKGGDRRLDPARITRVLILDGPSTRGETGRREVRFLAPEVAAARRPYRRERATPGRHSVPGRPTTAPAPIPTAAPAPDPAAAPAPAATPAAGAPDPPLFGLTTLPRNWQDRRDRWRDVFGRARHAGARLYSTGHTRWPELEPAPGRYDFAALDRMFTTLANEGDDTPITFDLGGPFFHLSPEVPAGLAAQAFDDARLVATYLAMVTELLRRFGHRISFLTVHAEGAGSQFETHPDRLPGFCRFVAATRARVRASHPAIRVGVNTDEFLDPAVVAALAKVTDFVGVDLGISGEVITAADLRGDPGAVARAIDRLVAAAAPTPVAFVNAGVSSAPETGGSEATQAEFIRQLAAALPARRAAVRFASVYAVHDEDRARAAGVYRALFPDFPDDFLAKMVADLSRCGLYRPDGSAKPALARFREGAAASGAR